MPMRKHKNQVLSASLVDMEKNHALLEEALRKMPIPVLKVFQQNGEIQPVTFVPDERHLPFTDQKEVQAKLPKTLQINQNTVLKAALPLPAVTNKRIGVLFSGGPAAGGHNVLAGLKKVLGEQNKLYGIKNGPKGLIAGELAEITSEDTARVMNLGGFDLLGSDRTKIKTQEQYLKVRKTVQDYQLNALIVVGGDDSNTNAAFLAEYLFDVGCSVIGVPKTIDGDLQAGPLLPISFGFDTATKIYAEMVGNILQDTPSSRKYWHFIKLMGRAASHVALEVALQTRAPITLISEEMAREAKTLEEIVEYIANIIVRRVTKGLDYGVVIVPEGLIEFIPEFHQLISEINEALPEIQEDLAEMNLTQKLALIKLSRQSAKLLSMLPAEIENKLFLERDAHGNLQVSQIPTEHLLIEMTERKIHEMKENPAKFFGADKLNLNAEELALFQKYKFQTNCHFFGYEGRCGAPSAFDAAYTYNLGLAAGSLALQGKGGYLVSITDFAEGGQALAVPITGLLTVERRDGHDSLVIQKALVDLESPAFHYFQTRRAAWADSDLFTSPGPRQWWGPLAHQMPFTVALNQGYSTLYYQMGKPL